jgi:hypothetical protein
LARGEPRIRAHQPSYLPLFDFNIRRAYRFPSVVEDVLACSGSHGSVLSTSSVVIFFLISKRSRIATATNNRDKQVKFAFFSAPQQRRCNSGKLGPGTGGRDFFHIDAEVTHRHPPASVTSLRASRRNRQRRPRLPFVHLDGHAVGVIEHAAAMPTNNSASRQ